MTPEEHARANNERATLEMFDIRLHTYPGAHENETWKNETDLTQCSPKEKAELARLGIPLDLLMQHGYTRGKIHHVLYGWKHTENKEDITMANATHVVTGKVRFSYEHIMKPYANTTNDPNAAPKYSVTVLVPKTDAATKARLDAGIAAAKQAGVAQKRYKDGTPLDRVPTPIYDGDGYRADGYTPFGPECKGCWVFTASCSQDRKPGVVDANGSPVIDPSEIYSGIYGRVSVDFFPYSFSGKQGVGCALCNVQKLADGDPLGAARPTAADDFGATGDFDPLG